MHVLIEKPIATTLEEADELLAIARAHRRDRADRARRAIQPRGARGAAVRRRAAIHRERSARAVQPARLGRRGRARPDDPRHRSRADARRRARRGRVGGRRAGADAVRRHRECADRRSTSGAVANITASRVSRERMRKLRIFQQSGYLSLDLGAGDGRVLSAARRRRSRRARRKAPLALESFVERIPLEAPEGEPLRLEFESFVAAVRGEQPGRRDRRGRSRGARRRAPHRAARSSERCHRSPAWLPGQRARGAVARA